MSPTTALAVGKEPAPGSVEHGLAHGVANDEHASAPDTLCELRGRGIMVGCTRTSTPAFGVAQWRAAEWRSRTGAPFGYRQREMLRILHARRRVHARAKADGGENRDFEAASAVDVGRVDSRRNPVAARRRALSSVKNWPSRKNVCGASP